MFHPHVATTLECLGSIYKMRREPAKAERVLQRALDINLRIHGEYHPSTLTCLEWLALVWKDMNRLDEAAKCTQRAKAISDVIGQVGERIAD